VLLFAWQPVWAIISILGFLLVALIVNRKFKLIDVANVFAWWPGSFWQISWSRFRQSKVGLIALSVFLLLLLAAVFAPLIAPYDFTKQNLLNVHSLPSLEHPFGTDGLGRDLFSRVLFGIRTSFIVAPVVVGITLFLGTSFGLMAGYFRGWIDSVIMRFCEFLSGFPGLLFAILISATIKPRILDFLRPYDGMINLGIVDFLVLFLALSFIGWSGLAIFVRGEVLRLQNSDFMEAARALGASPVRLMQRHLLPNLAAIIILLLSMSFPAVIMEEAILSFIGIGISDPNTSLGQLVNSEYGYWRTSQAYVVFIPAAVLAVLMYASVFLGDVLNDVLNPKSRMK
jgi:ABC-type dipeptide/oligopeptide/nickel transport system permease subunit